MRIPRASNQLCYFLTVYSPENHRKPAIFTRIFPLKTSTMCNLTILCPLFFSEKAARQIFFVKFYKKSQSFFVTLTCVRSRERNIKIIFRSRKSSFFLRFARFWRLSPREIGSFPQLVWCFCTNIFIFGHFVLLICTRNSAILKSQQQRTPAQKPVRNFGDFGGF